jgi:hypothetical protein
MAGRAPDVTTVPESPDDDFAWTLHVVHHDEHPIAPARCTLTRTERASFHRGSTDFGAALPPDTRISRRHARFRVDDTGALHVTDEGSRNGVHLRGERVPYATLSPGDVLRAGGFLLVAQPTPFRFEASDDPLLPGASALTSRLVRALRGHARDPGAGLVLLGEDGCPGRSAAALYARAGGASFGAFDDPGDAATLWFPRAWRAPPERLARALTSGRRVVFDATGAPRDWSPPPELAALPCEPIAPLRARREDIPAMLAARWRAAGIPWRPLSCARMTALLLAPWLGNDAAFERAVDALAAGDDDRVFGELLRAPPPAEPCDDGRAVIARDGSSFRTPEGDVVDLRPRPVLSRVLRSLATAERSRTVTEVTETAWPGVQLVGESGAARVYAAMATLRRLGLREAITHDGEGYLLDVKCVRVE